MNNKLHTLLSSFSKDDFKQFRLFAASPFFTSGKNYPMEKIQALLELIRKYFPKLEHESLSKENIFTSLYGSKKYNDTAVRNLFSDLTALVKEFLKYKKYSTQQFEKEHNLLIELFERKLDKEFLRQIDSSFKSFQHRDISCEYFYDRFRTYDYKAFYKGRTNITNHEEIQLMYNDFNSFYLLRVLQLFILMVNHESLVNFRFQKLMYEEVMAHIEKNSELYKNVPHVEIYYSLIQMFVKKDEAYFYNLKDLLKRHYSILSEVDKNNLFVCLGNYCLEQISKGNPKFNREKLENDDAYLKSGLLDEKHFINIYLFLGICRNALFIGETEWTGKLLQSKIERIAPEYRDYTKHYITAEILYIQGKYDAALDNLAKINIELPYFKQLIRNLTLKIYYEMKYFEEAKSLAETSDKYLTKGLELNDDVRADLKLFLKYYLKILKIKELKSADDPVSQAELHAIKNDFNSLRYFREKLWLSQKFAQLED